MNRNIPRIAAILSLSVSLSIIGQPAFAKTTFTPLKTGMRSAKVQEVEKMLAALHFDTKLKVDKYYNTYTASNVKKFQKKYKLKQTGVVDSKTYASIKQQYDKLKNQTPKPNPSTKPAPDNKPVEQFTTLKLGSAGDKVSELQKMLVALGYPAKVTGQYDESTRYAVMLFQSRNKATLTGEADSKTYQAIKTKYEQQPSQPQPGTPTQPNTPSQPSNPSQPSTPQKPDPQVPLPSDLTADEKEMIQLLNKERANNGLSPLQVDMKLENVARVKAQDLVKNNYFNHNSPTYGTPFQMMKSFGINYRSAAENLAQNWTVAAGHKMLMDSSGHRANIMNPSYEYVAIAIVDGGPYGKTFVQMFVE
ncbi:peptidoglycan-binding protein [Brevibacillus choshinensis]|uniref:peptidoglycan-binding protein n=1 Tax=Brevibacillus choshinensis TaxID=54911 RepID=UPI002E229795|nr:peptidoglycan-binding protein [Brevibacillus choshinensis]